MITEKLKELVVDEVNKLKSLLTNKEIERIKLLKTDVSKLSKLDPNHCIYGVITENCFSKRAKELLDHCSKPYSDLLMRYEEPNLLSKKIRSFTPLEFYIYQVGAKNIDIIKFLRNETKVLLI